MADIFNLYMILAEFLFPRYLLCMATPRKKKRVKTVTGLPPPKAEVCVEIFKVCKVLMGTYQL